MNQQYLEDMPYKAPKRFEILRLKSIGYTNKEIAEILSISPTTVRTRIHTAQEIYGAKTPTHLVAMMIKAGLL